jgi:predicted kinase
LPSIARVIIRAAFAAALVLVFSFVDPRKRLPQIVKSYHQQLEFFLLKSSTTLLHERSHGRYAGVPLDEVKKLLDIIPYRGAQLDPFGTRAA